MPIHRRRHSAIRRDAWRRIFLRAEHDRVAHDRHTRSRPYLDSREREGTIDGLAKFVTVLIVRFRMIGEGLATLYQVPAAVHACF